MDHLCKNLKLKVNNIKMKAKKCGCRKFQFLCEGVGLKYLGVIVNYSSSLETATKELHKQASRAMSESLIYQYISD